MTDEVVRGTDVVADDRTGGYSPRMFVCPECGLPSQGAGHCPADGVPVAPVGDDLILGTTIGAYRVARLLGIGGMGRVYKGVHPTIGSRVAIKVLSRECTDRRELVDRFFAEAKAVNLIRHESIVNVLDLSTLPDGRPYIIMEYLDGAPLASIIEHAVHTRTPLPLGGLARLAVEVLDALDAAHAKGIVHRDLKPDNIFVTPSGRPKVLDFGIAKLNDMTTGSATRTGSLLGTPHYMSPEQATADKEISGRSDIYSLASVLYEMLAGQPPHLGGSAQQIIMKIIAEPVQSVTALRKSVPPNVAAALDRALEKLPADRFPSAREFGDALLNPAFASSAGPGTRAGAPRPPSWRERAAIPALVLVVALALTTALALQRQQPPAPLSRYQVELPDGKGLGNTQWSPMAISPDGSHLAYIGESGRIVVRSREQLQPVELDGTDGAYNPFFSPDGLRVGFMSGAAGNAELRVVSLAGGPPVTVTSKGVGGPGVSWGADGFIYFDASGVGPLRRVRETGGQPFETVSTLDSVAGELQHDWPDALPNGRGVLVTINRGGPGVNISQSDDIGVIDLASGKHRVLVHGVFARYAASGHIIFVTAERVLMGVPFDQDRLEVTGNPLALVEGINIRIGGGGVDLAISRTGTLW
jgi:serine/threonine protein kinase